MTGTPLDADDLSSDLEIAIEAVATRERPEETPDETYAALWEFLAKGG